MTIRPCGPEPVRVATSTPLSAATARARGEARTRSPEVLFGAGGALNDPEVEGAGAGAAGAGAVAARPFAGAGAAGAGAAGAGAAGAGAAGADAAPELARALAMSAVTSSPGAPMIPIAAPTF